MTAVATTKKSGSKKDAGCSLKVVARIKRDNGFRDGPVTIESTPSKSDSWVKTRFVEVLPGMFVVAPRTDK